MVTAGMMLFTMPLTGLFSNCASGALLPSCTWRNPVHARKMAPQTGADQERWPWQSDGCSRSLRKPMARSTFHTSLRRSFRRQSPPHKYAPWASMAAKLQEGARLLGSSHCISRALWTGAVARCSLLLAPLLVRRRVAPSAHTAIGLMPAWPCGWRWRRRRRGRWCLSGLRRWSWPCIPCPLEIEA